MIPFFIAGIISLLIIYIAFRLLNKHDINGYEWLEELIKDKINDYYKGPVCKEVKVDQIGDFIFDDEECIPRNSNYLVTANVNDITYCSLLNRVSSTDAVLAARHIIILIDGK